MDIHPKDSRPSTQARSDYFTGDVRMEPIISAPEPARVRAVKVTFQPGARTHWHTHPLGQTLLVLSGQGRAQTRGGPVRVLNPGDTVWFDPVEEHWHGAAPDTGMCHLAIQEAQNGSAADWLDPVAEADYTADPA